MNSLGRSAEDVLHSTSVSLHVEGGDPLGVVWSFFSSATVVGIAASLVGAVLFLSGMLKSQNPLPAAMAIVNFRVTRRVRLSSAYALAGAEIIVGIALILRIDTQLVDVPVDVPNG